MTIDILQPKSTFDLNLPSDLAEQLIEDRKYYLRKLGEAGVSQVNQSYYTRELQKTDDALEEEGIDANRIESLTHATCLREAYIAPHLYDIPALEAA